MLGLRLLLADKSTGSCCVTANRRIVDSITKHYAENKIIIMVDYHVCDRYFAVISIWLWCPVAVCLKTE